MIEISPLRRGDLDDAMEVERHAFRAPWPRQVLEEEFERPFAHMDVLREDGRIVAFVNYWLVADEVHLLNVATHIDARRRGHADRLVAHVLGFAREHRCRYVALEVRRSNDAAQALYRKHGFRNVGVRKKYYADDGEDAIVMLLDLGAAARE